MKCKECNREVSLAYDKAIEAMVEALEKIKNPEPLQFHWAVAENALAQFRHVCNGGKVAENASDQFRDATKEEKG